MSSSIARSPFRNGLPLATCETTAERFARNPTEQPLSPEAPLPLSFTPSLVSGYISCFACRLQPSILFRANCELSTEQHPSS